jgi:hypothetical protein
MSSISPVPTSSIQSASLSGPATDQNRLSQAAPTIAATGELASMTNETIDKINEPDGMTGTNLLTLQGQTQALQLSTMMMSAEIKAMSDNLKTPISKI